MQPNSDPFREPRTNSGTLVRKFDYEQICMILRHEDVRKAAKDWQTFSSNAPFRVPIPSEENLRTMRQLPLETDPPEHAEYREILEPFFRRAKDPSVVARIEALFDGLLTKALKCDSIEAVHDLAIPYQCGALALLLNVAEEEVATWISWDLNVFLGGKEGEHKGSALETYLNQMLDRSAENPGDDFFGALHQARFRGRSLTREEMMGFAILTFAGGRDTVIHTCTSALAYLGKNPAALGFLREDPKRVVNAAEELFRIVSPLTHLGRVCPVKTGVLNETVEAGDRVSLCWASANRDELVFPAPDEVRLDRKPNPHVAFGAGIHLCIGAPHARLLLRTLLLQCSQRVRSIVVLDAVPHVESVALLYREVGYDSLTLKLHPR
jgi:cytochrome P450